MNPRMGPLDLKFFLEMRVGLMSWALITLSLLWEAHRADNLNTPMALLAGAQLLYIADALLFEVSGKEISAMKIFRFLADFGYLPVARYLSSGKIWPLLLQGCQPLLNFSILLRKWGPE